MLQRPIDFSLDASAWNCRVGGYCAPSRISANLHDALFSIASCHRFRGSLLDKIVQYIYDQTHSKRAGIEERTNRWSGTWLPCREKQQFLAEKCNILIVYYTWVRMDNECSNPRGTIEVCSICVRFASSSCRGNRLARDKRTRFRKKRARQSDLLILAGECGVQ